MHKKDIISIIYLTVLTAIALVYGFVTIPSPTEQHQIVLDQKRVSDLGEIKQNIEDYYTTNKHLPRTLTDIKRIAYNSQPVSLTDPETNAPYAYTILAAMPPRIQLCATFSTAAKDDQEYQDYSDSYNHPKGNYCFKLDITSYIPTPTISETPITATPTVPKHPVK